MKIFRTLFAAALVLAFMPGAMAAQTQGATAQVQVNENLSITVTNTALDFGATAVADTMVPGVSSVISHSGNVVHTVQIAADAAFFDAINAANDGTKPAGDLEWSMDAGTNWNPLSTTAADIHTSAAIGSYPSDETIDYQLLVDAADAADTYTLAFTFSVISG